MHAACPAPFRLALESRKLQTLSVGLKFNLSLTLCPSKMAAKPRKSEEPPPSSIEQEEEEESTPLTKPTGTSVATPISTSTDDGFKQETDSTPSSNADASSQENEEESTEKPKPSNILANANGSETTTKKKNKRKSEPGEDANSNANASEKKKKNKSASSKRVWSDADEVELLSGMANFIEKEGRNPSTHLDEFLASIKNSLGFDVSATQLYDKMRRLKKRYLDNRERLSKNGDYPSFANPHEQELYELSKMIWGTGVNVSSGGKKNKKRTGDGGVSKAIDDGKKRKRNRRKTSDEVVTSTTREEEEEEKDLSKYPCLNMMAEEGKDMLAIPNVVLEKYLSKEGFSLLSSAQKKVLDLKWEIRQDEEADIYYRKLELARQMERELNDAIMSKRHNQKTVS